MAKARRKPAAKTTPEQVISTTLGMIPQNEPMQAPYSVQAAPRTYSSWVYACAQLRAQAMASVPLRLYTRSSGQMKAMGASPHWTMRSVPKRRAKYLHGESRNRPHSSVVTKALEIGEMEEVIGSPASELLRRVNPWQGGFELLTLLGINLNLMGMAYWYVSRGGVGGTPDLIMDLAPRKMEIVPSYANFIEGYVYGRNEAKPIALSPDEVVYFRRPNPRDPWYGYGMAEAAWSVINQNVAVHEMDTAFFRNYARPDALVTITGTQQGQSQIDRFKAELAQQVGGRSKTGRLLTVTGQVDVKPLSFPPKDLSGRDEIVEEICAVFQVPVTLVKANDPNLASATQGYSNFREFAVAVDCRLIEDALNQSYLPMWGLGEDAFFAFDNPIIEDEDRESQIADRRLRAGVVKISEVREELGYEEADDPMADRLLFGGQPLGASPVSQMGPVSGSGNTQDSGNSGDRTSDHPKEDPKPTEAGAAAAASDPNAAVQDTALNGAQVTALVELIVQSREGIVPVDAAQAIAAAAFPLMTPEQLSAIFNPIRSAKPLPQPEPAPAQNAPPSGEARPEKPATSQKAFLFGEVEHACGCIHKAADDPLPLADELSERELRRYIGALDAVLKAQAEAVAERLASQGVPTSQMIGDIDREIRDQKWVVQIKGASEPYVRHGMTQGITAGARVLPQPLADRVSFDYANPEVQRYVDKATTRLATGLNETTSVKVREVLGSSLSEGKTIPQITERVKSTMQVDGARAETIARTESARAYSQGQVEAWKQTGVVKGKRWVLAPDACEFCRAAARLFGETPVDLNQPFFPKGATLAGVKGGVMTLDYDDVNGPPLHPNDRCSVSAVLE